jgi:hypothetical protein
VLLYRVVSPIVLGLLFYVTVTPIALVMRLLGKTRCDCAAIPMPRAIGSLGRRRGPRLNP